ncbi:hypothetical protein [Microbacterium deminutum]|uniref:Uncharacterized protein n=1 Tax=Microbacterium deminutum TaxID=344164 RepID=A0ABP5CCQ8_9MICO
MPYCGEDNIGVLLVQHPTRAQHVTLAIILGGIESSTSRDTWRRPSARDADYLARLAGWGYDLSNVEQLVTGKKGPESNSDAHDEAAPEDDDVVVGAEDGHETSD